MHLLRIFALFCVPLKNFLNHKIYLSTIYHLSHLYILLNLQGFELNNLCAFLYFYISNVRKCIGLHISFIKCIPLEHFCSNSNQHFSCFMVTVKTHDRYIRNILTQQIHCTLTFVFLINCGLWKANWSSQLWTTVPNLSHCAFYRHPFLGFKYYWYSELGVNYFWHYTEHYDLNLTNSNMNTTTSSS